MNPTPVTKREVAQRKDRLVQDLRAAARVAPPGGGEMLGSVRELSTRYGLALRTVSLELQKLADEGVLYTVPRVGTFVGRPPEARSALFLVLTHLENQHEPQRVAFRTGFEERIARLGGTSLAVPHALLAQFRAQSPELVPSGIYCTSANDVERVTRGENGISTVPMAYFGTLREGAAYGDGVDFDNEGGGWQAARHLLSLGHRRIAFMGLHGRDNDPGQFYWSALRAQGWRRAMEENGVEWRELEFCPQMTGEPSFEGQRAVSRELAQQLAQIPDITAVVAANSFAARGLFRVLAQLGRPAQQWPAVVGFDSELVERPDQALHTLTALRLPWEDLGREAANVLWERAHGKTTGAPVQRLVPMSLIPRLSCRREWIGMAALASMERLAG